MSLREKSQEGSQRRNSPTVPICPGCRSAMVLTGKRSMPLTNLMEVTYRCEKCGTETKRMIKEQT
jgi:C4-type Zn-finger protein